MQLELVDRLVWMCFLSFGMVCGLVIADHGVQFTLESSSFISAAHLTVVLYKKYYNSLLIVSMKQFYYLDAFILVQVDW